ncbi:unnamed protein product [Orchesella dallaii]|uniref:C2H2-type domain-containing protein n=1 Tax=Orchesella dallaii TaxID=48710 RepID=A0ABP1Q328_9HEXA
MDGEGRQDRTKSGGWFKKLTNWFRRRRAPQLEPGDIYQSDEIEDTRIQSFPTPDVPETESTEADQNQLRLPNDTDNEDTAHTSVSTAQPHDSPRLPTTSILKPYAPPLTNLDFRMVYDHLELPQNYEEIERLCKSARQPKGSTSIPLYPTQTTSYWPRPYFYWSGCKSRHPTNINKSEEIPSTSSAINNILPELSELCCNCNSHLYATTAIAHLQARLSGETCEHVICSNCEKKCLFRRGCCQLCKAKKWHLDNAGKPVWLLSSLGRTNSTSNSSKPKRSVRFDVPNGCFDTAAVTSTEETVDLEALTIGTGDETTVLKDDTSQLAFTTNLLCPQCFYNISQHENRFMTNSSTLSSSKSDLRRNDWDPAGDTNNVLEEFKKLEIKNADGHGKEEMEVHEVVPYRKCDKSIVATPEINNQSVDKPNVMNKTPKEIGKDFGPEINSLRPSTPFTLSGSKHVAVIEDADDSADGSKRSPHIPSLIISNSRIEENTRTQNENGPHLKLNEEELHPNQWKTNVVLERHPEHKITDPMQSKTNPPTQLATAHTSSSSKSLRVVNRENLHSSNTEGTLKRKRIAIHNNEKLHEKFIRGEENERRPLQHAQNSSYNEITINLNKSGPTSTLLSCTETNILRTNVSKLTIQKEKDTYINVKEANNENDNAMSSTEIQDANNDQEIYPDGIFSSTSKSSNKFDHNQIPIGIQEDQFLHQVYKVPRLLINGQQNVETQLATNHGVEKGAIPRTSENQLIIQQDEEEEMEIGMIPGQNCGMRKSAGNRIENEESGNERAEKQSDRGSDELRIQIGEDEQHAREHEQNFQTDRIPHEKAPFQEDEGLQDGVTLDEFPEIGDHNVIDFNDFVSEPLSNSKNTCVTKLNLHRIHCEQESNDVKEQGISRELLQERNHIEEEEISKLPVTQEYVNLHCKETINNIEEEINGIPLPIGNTLKNMETLNWQNVQETNQSANQNVNAKDESSNIIEHDRIIEGIQPEPNIQQVLETLPFLQLHNQQNHENIESQSATNNRMENSLPDPMRNEILPTQSGTQVSRESLPSTSKDTTLKRKRNDLKEMYKTRTTNLNHYQKPKSQQVSVASQIGKQTNQDAREVQEPETKNLSSNGENVSKKQKVDSKNASAFLCGICGQTFKNQNSYKLHEIRHEGEEPYKFKCPAPNCDKRFLDERKMKLHFVNHTKNIRCMDCNMSFASQSNLNQHKTIHTGERPFICEYCGTRFRLNSKLQDHLRIHTGERPYTCNDCDQTFKTSSVLYRHMKIHSVGGPYNCDVCHKSFTRKRSKTLHMITHSWVHPYTCDVCDKSYTQKGSKTRHMKQFHKNQLQDTNEGKDIEPQPGTSRGSNNI